MLSIFLHPLNVPEAVPEDVSYTIDGNILPFAPSASSIRAGRTTVLRAVQPLNISLPRVIPMYSILSFCSSVGSRKVTVVSLVHPSKVPLLPTELMPIPHF